MTYEEIVSTIDNKRRFGKACGRDVTKEFMRALGYPEREIHFIHIAGTNGKGSVAAFVSSILQAASFASKEQFKVGLFTSPHLIEYTERIQIDGNQIPREEVVRIGEMLLSTKLELEPTMFDYWLAMAMVYFKEQNVKYVVLETGLGGTKDSTNGLSVKPDVCAITSIGLEHTHYLGNTIQEIAKEKAGIIKEQVPVVIGEMPREAQEVIINRCKELGCSYSIPKELSVDKKIGLYGNYQRKNGAVGVDIVKYLNLGINNQTIDRGLAKATWAGRMQVISEKPFIMLDGAHNPSGVKALHDSLVKEFPDDKFTFIMAVMADKDYLAMSKIIEHIARRIYTVSIESDRAMQAEALAQAMRQTGIDAKSYEEYNQAIQDAKTKSEKIIVCGSLYFIGEVLASKG